MVGKLEMRATGRLADLQAGTIGTASIVRAGLIFAAITARHPRRVLPLAAVAGLRIGDDAGLSAAANAQPERRPTPRKELRHHQQQRQQNLHHQRFPIILPCIFIHIRGSGQSALEYRRSTAKLRCRQQLLRRSFLNLIEQGALTGCPAARLSLERRSDR